MAIKEIGGPVALTSQLIAYRRGLDSEDVADVIRTETGVGDLPLEELAGIEAARLRLLTAANLGKLGEAYAVVHSPAVPVDDSYVMVDHVLFSPVGAHAVVNVSSDTGISFTVEDGVAYVADDDPLCPKIEQLVDSLQYFDADFSFVFVPVYGEGLASIGGNGFIANAVVAQAGEVRRIEQRVVFLPAAVLSEAVGGFVEMCASEQDAVKEASRFADTAMIVD